MKSWEKIKDSYNPQIFENFIRSNLNGRFATAAVDRLWLMLKSRGGDGSGSSSETADRLRRALRQVEQCDIQSVDVADRIHFDPSGKPTNDPDVMFAVPPGALVPFGDHKGYGLSFICEVLAGALINGGTCVPRNQTQNTTINSMLSVVLDPNALGDADVFRRELDEITTYVKSARTGEGFEKVLVPGDPERLAKEELSGQRNLYR